MEFSAEDIPFLRKYLKIKLIFSIEWKKLLLSSENLILKFDVIPGTERKRLAEILASFKITILKLC